ncbi:hypothetical protein JW796_03720 [Candidatus Dojkabacteria bacterium]|nr:hypothetical protein [Candidatus Dojkabacteria bacterium]
MPKNNIKQNTAERLKSLYKRHKKLILIIGGILVIALIFGFILLFTQNTRTIRENSEYNIQYDRSEDRYIVTPNENFSADSLIKIYADLQELCKNSEDIENCTLFNLPGVALGVSNEELKQIEENESNIQKAIEDIKQGKKSFGLFEQSPSQVD